MFYIMIVIVIVAAFCILCSLATSVVRKTREIGVLGVARRAARDQIGAVFCLQGLLIGAVGTLLGVGLSLLLLHFRQPIVKPSWTSACSWNFTNSTASRCNTA